MAIANPWDPRTYGNAGVNVETTAAGGGFPWGAAASFAPSIIGGIGAFAGAGDDKERGPIPLDANRESMRNYMRARDTFLYGPTDDWGGSGKQVHPMNQGGGGGFMDMYTNPENWPQFGPQPYAPMNQYTRNAIDQLGGLGSTVMPEMAAGLANATMGGMAGDSAQNPFYQQFAQMSPMFQQSMQGGPAQVGYGGINADQFRPSQGQIYGPEGQAALSNQLSGDADVRGFQGAMDAYLGDAMEQFNEQLLPSMQRADYMSQGGQSSAGALKAAQRTQEQIGEGLGRYGQELLYKASGDALNRQGSAVGQVGQTGLGRYALGNQTGVQDAGMALDASRANASLTGDYRQQLLASMGLGVNSASNKDQNAYRYANLSPAAMDAMFNPAKASTMAGDMQAGYDDRDAAFAADQFNYNEQLPYNMGNQFLGLMNGTYQGMPVPASSGGGGSGNPWLSGGMTALGLWPQNDDGSMRNLMSLFG